MQCPIATPQATLSRRLYRLAAFLLFGFLSGVAWFPALMPVGITGAVGYDVSRYGFALGVLVAIVGLFFRPWREYGLVVFFVGLLLGITCCAVLFPLQPGGRVAYVVALFGFLTIVLPSLGSLLARSRTRGRKPRLAGDSSSPAAVPRRFGMGTLMIVMLAISLLFAIAKWLDIPAPLSLWAGSFLGIIGGLQVLMNKVPRVASVGTGTVLLPLTLAATWSTIGADSYPLLATVVTTPADIVFVGAHLAALGAVLVAGLFLVIELASPDYSRSEHTSP